MGQGRHKEITEVRRKEEKKEQGIKQIVHEAMVKKKIKIKRRIFGAQRLIGQKLHYKEEGDAKNLLEMEKRKRV